MARSSKKSLYIRVHHQRPAAICQLPAHLISLILILIIFIEDCKLPHHKIFPTSPATSVPSDPNISLSTLFSNTLSLPSYFSVRD